MNLTNKLDKDGLIQIKKNIKNIFFYRICGTGMGASACLLKEMGYNIEGADIEFAPPMSDYLETTQIPCHTLDKIDMQYLQKFDLIITGNVVCKDSDDAHKIEQSGVPFISFPTAIGSLVLDDKIVIGCAGTHGKTTTTYLITQLFENLNCSPGYFIGGIMDDRPPAKLGDSKYFFIESDEYDSAYFEKISKLRMYSINHMILTSLEFDHADIFNNIEEILDQFRAIIPSIDGRFIVNEDYPGIQKLYKEYSDSHGQWIYYGLKSNIGPKILGSDKNGTDFQLTLNSTNYDFKTNLTGEHNILNLSSAIIFAFYEGFAIGKIQSAITNLNMVKRRQEERGYYNGSLVIDDFAHHPRAVDLTIDSMKIKYPGKQIVTIIEPKSATARSNIFQDEFTQSLKKSDSVILAIPESSTSVKWAGDIDCVEIARQLQNDGIQAKTVNNLNELLALINELANENTLLLILSNSTCLGLWESDFVKQLK